MIGGVASVETAIEVRDLRKSYGELEAVRGIEFTVRRGEIYGLLGPNGAGKTSTVEILEGYRERSAGHVSVLGFDPNDRPRELRARVGIVLQSSGIYNYASVAESLSHFAHFYPHPRDVDEVIELAGLTEKRDARARTLSGGQRRRLDLALALVGDPELIFLDEPTTGFDPAARRGAWQTIRSLRELGRRCCDDPTSTRLRNSPIASRSSRAGGSSPRAHRASSESAAGRATASPTRTRRRPNVIETDDPTRLLHELTAPPRRGEQLRSLSSRGRASRTSIWS